MNNVNLRSLWLHRAGCAATHVLQRLRVHQRAMRRNSRRWLEAHPRINSLLHSTGALNTRVESIAKGVAVGLFIGLTPTVGGQTIFMLAGCMLLRGNFPAAFAVSWVSNPLTLPVLCWVCYETGAGVMSRLMPLAETGLTTSLFGFGDEILMTGVGSLLIATPAAVAGYFLTPSIMRLFRSRPRFGMVGLPLRSKGS